MLPRESRIVRLLKGYAYNTMEICRALNGLDPRAFQGCYYSFSLAGRHPRCKYKENYYSCTSGSVDMTLRRMAEKGLVHSVKLRWFDGRNKGAAENSLQLDLFRFYYLTKPGLARRLKDDIRTHLEKI